MRSEKHSALTGAPSLSRVVWSLFAVCVLLAFLAQMVSAQGCGDCSTCCCGTGCTQSRQPMGGKSGPPPPLQCPPDWDCGCSSPIIVDTTGHGFRLTSAEEG